MQDRLNQQSLANQNLVLGHNEKHLMSKYDSLFESYKMLKTKEGSAK